MQFGVGSARRGWLDRRRRAQYPPAGRAARACCSAPRRLKHVLESCAASRRGLGDSRRQQVTVGARIVWTLGETLRQARLDKGVSLADAARDTRIRRSYLEALEAEDLAALPPPVYTRGFLRTYAEYLGLNAAGDGRPVPAVGAPRAEPDAARRPCRTWRSRARSRCGRCCTASAASSSSPCSASPGTGTRTSSTRCNQATPPCAQARRGTPTATGARLPTPFPIAAGLAQPDADADARADAAVADPGHRRNTGRVSDQRARVRRGRRRRQTGCRRDARRRAPSAVCRWPRIRSSCAPATARRST